MVLVMTPYVLDQYRASKTHLNYYQQCSDIFFLFLFSFSENIVDYLREMWFCMQIQCSILRVLSCFDATIESHIRIALWLWISQKYSAEIRRGCRYKCPFKNTLNQHEEKYLRANELKTVVFFAYKPAHMHIPSIWSWLSQPNKQKRALVFTKIILLSACLLSSASTFFFLSSFAFFPTV